MAPFLWFLPLLSLLFTTTSPSPITIPLTHTNPHPDPYQNFTQLASSSITRVHHLKNPQNAPVYTTPLTSRSYGAYSINLSFGTPPQILPFIMDTGSNFVWFPCTQRYACENCLVSSIQKFIPELSSSARTPGCVNPKCFWFNQQPPCVYRKSDLRKFNHICPAYIYLYGSGFTEGNMLLETLDLPGKKVPEFLVGCSNYAYQLPTGIAGFGRGHLSLPSRLGLKKFSYCLGDKQDKSSLMVLDDGYNSGEKTGNMSYTPLLKNPVIPGNDALGSYYYVALRKITINSKRVKIPRCYLSPGPGGIGGTIVDSGTTYTALDPNVFFAVTNEIIQQAKGYKRAKGAEEQFGSKLCFDTAGRKAELLPKMSFHFEGGAEMALPLENYFYKYGKAHCLTLESYHRQYPAIVLGSYQMRNYYVEYDLRNERFGFRQQSCN